MNKLFIGQDIDGDLLELDPMVLLKHVMVLGASGSGKTYLSKVIVEEAVRFGIPVIAIDSQGDIASLALAGCMDRLSASNVEVASRYIDISNDYWSKVDLKIWTPGSEWGLPISLQPNLETSAYERHEDKVRAIHGMGGEVAALAGFCDEATVAGLSKIIHYADDHSLVIDTLDDVCAFLRDPPLLLRRQLEDIFDDKSRKKVLHGLMVKRNGPRQLMMELGKPLDIDTLLGHELNGATDNGKVRVSIIALNGLSSLEDKQIFLAAFARNMYGWMIQDPKPYPVGMVFIDECSHFLPPVRKPVSKEPVLTLLRQARKYGVSMLLATQSPGDIDFIGMGQIGTKFIGRMSTLQEAAKVSPLLDNSTDHLIDQLPELKQGEFFGVCSDMWDGPVTFRSRTLISRHETMTLEQMNNFVDDKDREIYV